MRHTHALQRDSDGRWDVVTATGGNVYGAGYCGGKLVTYGSAPVAEGLYHTDGHETKEEAEACYRGFLVDTQSRAALFDDVQMRCKQCNEWTQHYVQIGVDVWPLCAGHQGRERLLDCLGHRGVNTYES